MPIINYFCSMRILRKIALTLFILFSAGLERLSAQCAMCRATLENNISNGHIGIAENLNFGILYLLGMPYMAFVVLGFFWYRYSKANERLAGSN